MAFSIDQKERYDLISKRIKIWVAKIVPRLKKSFDLKNEAKDEESDVVSEFLKINLLVKKMEEFKGELDT